MSRPKFKFNKLAYIIRVISLIYLIPIILLCGLSKTLKWLFVNLDKITSYLFYKPMDAISGKFPFKGDKNE